MKVARRVILYIAVAALYLLHNDLWLWNDARRLAGIPVGLLYHLVYCFVAAAMMGLLVKWAWPPDLKVDLEVELEVALELESTDESHT